MSWTVLIALGAAIFIGMGLGMSLGALGRMSADEEVIRLRLLLEENNIAVWWEYTD